MRALYILAALAAFPIPSLATQGLSCPNQRSTPFPGTDQAIPPFRDCHSQLEIFGFSIPFGAQRCPAGRMVVPAHEECLGTTALGQRCQDLGMVPVLFATCSCESSHGLGMTVTRCVCRDIGWAGFLPTAQTAACP